MGFRGFRSFGVSKVHKLGFSEAKYPTRTSHIFSGRFRFWDACFLLKGLGVQGFQGMFLGFNWCVRYFHAGLLDASTGLRVFSFGFSTALEILQGFAIVLIGAWFCPMRFFPGFSESWEFLLCCGDLWGSNLGFGRR